MKLSALQLSMAKMGYKYPDTPWRASSLTPAIKNKWVGGEYKFDDNLQPFFCNSETRDIKNSIEGRAVYYSNQALGFSSVGLIKQMVKLNLRLI